MFITKQRAIRPNSLVIDGCSVEVVDKFNLIGISIDHNLFFNKYVDRLKSSVNQILYSGYLRHTYDVKVPFDVKLLSLSKLD